MMVDPLKKLTQRRKKKKKTSIYKWATFSGNSSQVKSEIDWFTDVLKKNGVTSYLEIGSRHGDSFHHVMSSLPVGSVGVAVDLPDSVWGRSDSESSLKRAVDDLNEKGYLCTMILGDSRSEVVIEQVRARGPFDAVFIDGDHTEFGVTSDFKNYSPMGSLIGFHDIAGRKNACFAVAAFWESLEGDKAQFVEVGSQMGIGVIRV